MKYPEKVLLLCDMLNEKNAKDIVVCDCQKLNNTADYMIIATCEDVATIRETVDFITQRTQEMPTNFEEMVKEGFNLSEWVVLTFDKTFVEIFTKDERDHYNLEKLLNEGGNISTYKRIQKQLENEEKKKGLILKQKEKQESSFKKKNLKEQEISENSEISSLQSKKVKKVIDKTSIKQKKDENRVKKDKISSKKIKKTKEQELNKKDNAKKSKKNSKINDKKDKIDKNNLLKKEKEVRK